ncbi:MAG: hypothetical protein AB1414_19550 [bacterium]
MKSGNRSGGNLPQRRKSLQRRYGNKSDNRKGKSSGRIKIRRKGEDGEVEKRRVK